jgi:hypothetical protein
MSPDEMEAKELFVIEESWGQGLWHLGFAALRTREDAEKSLAYGKELSEKYKIPEVVSHRISRFVRADHS